MITTRVTVQEGALYECTKHRIKQVLRRCGAARRTSRRGGVYDLAHPVRLLARLMLLQAMSVVASELVVLVLTHFILSSSSRKPTFRDQFPSARFNAACDHKRALAWRATPYEVLSASRPSIEAGAAGRWSTCDDLLPCKDLRTRRLQQLIPSNRREQSLQ